jgi:di/tricarboxylate transporter
MAQTWFTIIVVLVMVIALAKDILRPPLVVWSALLLLILGKVVSIDEAFVGFSNTGMITVAFLFIVSSALRASKNFEKSVHALLGGENKSIRSRYFRLLFPVAGFSAFLNNTPIVAALIPMIKSWARKHHISPSKFLIPLSYAAILGGTCTLIGTSTNLVIHGLLLEKNMEGLSFFSITKIGLPITIIMLVLITIFAKYLLPDRKDITTIVDETTKEFVAELLVEKDFKGIGKNLENAGLKQLAGVFLFQIERKNGKFITPIRDNETIQEGDRMFFSGQTKNIYDLQKTKGLKFLKDIHFDFDSMDSGKIKAFEAVISSNSSLIGSTAKKSDFRRRFNSCIIAIHRSGQRINRKIGAVKLKPGDTLFLLAHKDFLKKWGNKHEFSLVSSSFKIYEKPRWKGNLGLLFLILMIITAALKILPIVVAAGLTALLMVFFKIIDYEEVNDSINWEVLAIIASSFGIAKGIENSGVAQGISNIIIGNLSFLGPMGIIAGTFFIISTLTWFINNKAVAASMFPIILSIAEKTPGIGVEPMIMTLIFASSACFATPLGFQTNMMVFGAGGYKFKDFLKIGIPMNLIIGIIFCILVYFMYFN